MTDISQGQKWPGIEVIYYSSFKLRKHPVWRLVHLFIRASKICTKSEIVSSTITVLYYQRSLMCLKIGKPAEPPLCSGREEILLSPLSPPPPFFFLLMGHQGTKIPHQMLTGTRSMLMLIQASCSDAPISNLTWDFGARETAWDIRCGVQPFHTV